MGDKSLKKLNKTQAEKTSVENIKVKNAIIETEFREIDPAFCCDETDEETLNDEENLEEQFSDETIFDDNLEQLDSDEEIEDLDDIEEIEELEEVEDFDDSLVVDEDLLQELEQGGNIFDGTKRKNGNALVDSFLLKEKKLKHIDSPFLSQIEKLTDKDAEENTGKSELKETMEIEKTEDNIQLKQEQRAKLMAISENIMKENEEVANLNKNNNNELGEKVKKIESPFIDIEGKERGKLNNDALNVSPFLVPTAIDAVAKENEGNKEPTIITEKVIEKQTPIVIQNVQKVNNDEINEKMQVMAERIDKLSQMVMPLENINHLLSERLFNQCEQRKEKQEKTNISDEIVCDVCGHINKKGSSVCEQCSNIFENA